MTHTDTHPATATATATDTDTGILEAALAAAAPYGKSPRKKSKARPTAKAPAYFALISTGLLVLAEPWLLLPVAALVLAISLWD